MSRRARAPAEHGGAATDLVMVTPLLLVFMLVMVGLGRFAQARAEVDGAARDAARAASISREASSAADAAQEAAAATLADRGVTCEGGPQVATDTSQFRPGGWVAVEVGCSVSLAELGLTGLPASRSFSARAVQYMDRYREAGP